MKVIAMILRDEDILKLEEKDLLKLVKNYVYDTGLIFERLEHLKLIDADGYQLRQKLASYAMKLVKEHLNERDES